MEPYAQTETTETNIFADLETVYEDASVGQRFLNAFIDNLLMRYVVSLGVSNMVVKLLLNYAPETAFDLFGTEDRWTLFLASYMLGLINYFFYYTICEKAFKGHTLGKLITGTRAIREDGGELTLRDALLRSLVRMVPFEGLSIWFGNGIWHDSWTKTRVIKTR